MTVAVPSPVPFHDAVIVSADALAQDDPFELVVSNTMFVASLAEAHVLDDEQAPDALLSHRLDIYLGQMENGGVSQLVYNTRWSKPFVDSVREGLGKIGADSHLRFFEEVDRFVVGLGDDGLSKFLESDYFGTNAVRDSFSTLDERFGEVDVAESLVERHARWLRAHPKLEALDDAAWHGRVTALVSRIPDLEVRKQRALDAEPDYLKRVRALCASAGYAFDRITAGDPNHQHRVRLLGFIPWRVRVLAWHFLTDHGVRFMVEYGGEAMMFEQGSDVPVATLPVS